MQHAFSRFRRRPFTHSELLPWPPDSLTLQMAPYLVEAACSLLSAP